VSLSEGPEGPNDTVLTLGQLRELLKEISLGVVHNRVLSFYLHFPQAWSTVLAGGGIRGGQVVGKTSRDGLAVEDRPVAMPDLLGTVCLALGIDYTKTNPSNVGRPIRIVDQSAKPLTELVAGA